MTNTLREIVSHQSFNFTSSAILLLAYLAFLYNHITSIYFGTLSPTGLIFVAMESTVILLIFLRRVPVIRSDKLTAWLSALGATFAPLLLVPSGVVVQAHLGDALMILGGILAVLSYWSLNTSFGVSPALRSVKTSGLYRFVRHPMYASYLVLYAGYLLIAFSFTNVAVIFVLVCLLVARIHFEEEILQTDAIYKEYKKTVRYRLVPLVF
ncbi:MAG: isoprenylcysteine carboxylmethyltransferase family protein [Patescibacteria group bacterium]